MTVLDFLSASTALPEAYTRLSMTDMEDRVRRLKQQFGPSLFIPGHHYQKNEVIQFADATGDSLQLAQLSAQNTQADYIVFCGVHFMAETADILTGPEQKVILPDLRAGCSMADMADITQTEKAWEALQTRFGNTILPLTYVNSTAAIKAFCGRHGGATVTSSNAKKMIEWAFTQKERMMFLPDQHLGRNTCYDLGIPLDQMAVWDPIEEKLIVEDETKEVRVILWKGHCSVHEKFTAAHIHQLREEEPEVKVIVHPECTHDVVQLADDAGSTNHIIQTLKNAPAGTKWAVGTEMNLVNRLAQELSHISVRSLNPNLCPCLTMNRIDLPHLLWILDSLNEGDLRHQITVEPHTAEEARWALNRMLDRA
ncbi:quinolinate synthase NadA [Caldalkalibacillus salinus]|uniref:quinolinate synthase NadA n=1 Tax=Caldalkalibacillus salinus TaxID=2803787 RepID=UPI001924A49F|nr:quinolinate synthase NadA [Caldalkalibacillus salinus]